MADNNPHYITIKMFDRDALEWAAKIRSIQMFFEEEGVECPGIDLTELICVFTAPLVAQTTVKRSETITAKVNGHTR